MTDKLLIDRELLERVCHRDNSTRQLARRELRTILTQTATEVEAVEVVCITQGGCNVTWTATKEPSHAGTALMAVAQHNRIIAQLTGTK